MICTCGMKHAAIKCDRCALCWRLLDLKQVKQPDSPFWGVRRKQGRLYHQTCFQLRKFGRLSERKALHQMYRAISFYVRRGSAGSDRTQAHMPSERPKAIAGRRVADPGAES